MSEIIKFPGNRLADKKVVESELSTSITAALGEGLSEEFKARISRLILEMGDESSRGEISSRLSKADIRSEIEEQWWSGRLSGNEQMREEAVKRLRDRFGDIRAGKILEGLDIRARLIEQQRMEPLKTEPPVNLSDFRKNV